MLGALPILPFNPDDSSAVEIISMACVRTEDGDTKQLAQGHTLVSESQQGPLPSEHASCPGERVCPFPFSFGLKQVDYLITV